MRSIALVPFLALVATIARADEKEWTISAAPAFSFVHVGDDRTAYGGGAAVDVSYGVTDALSIRATGAFAAHHVGALTMDNKLLAPAGTVTAWHAGAGVGYTIDIVRVVPSLEFAIGWLGCSRPDGKSCLRPDQAAATETAFDHLGVEIGVAVDYLVNRRFSVGVVARYHAFLTALAQLPAFFYAGPRLSIRFGG